MFHDYFQSVGLASAETPFSGRSDYGPFIALNVPAGGLFTGAEDVKTAEQAAIFGGTAGSTVARRRTRSPRRVTSSIAFSRAGVGFALVSATTSSGAPLM